MERVMESGGESNIAQNRKRRAEEETTGNICKRNAPGQSTDEDCVNCSASTHNRERQSSVAAESSRRSDDVAGGGQSTLTETSAESSENSASSSSEEGGSLDELIYYQNQHIAKAIVDNAINSTLEDLGLSPACNMTQRQEQVEEEGVALVICQQGLQRPPSSVLPSTSARLSCIADLDNQFTDKIFNSTDLASVTVNAHRDITSIGATGSGPPSHASGTGNIICEETMSFQRPSISHDTEKNTSARTQCFPANLVSSHSLSADFTGNRIKEDQGSIETYNSDSEDNIIVDEDSRQCVNLPLLPSSELHVVQMDEEEISDSEDNSDCHSLLSKATTSLLLDHAVATVIREKGLKMDNESL